MTSTVPDHRRSYDRVAAEYRNSRLSYPERMMAWMMRHVAARKRGVALDLGCGPGTLSLPLVRRFRKVLALDLAGEMLRELRQASQQQIQRPTPVRGMGEALPLRSQSVEFIACSQSLHWMQLPHVLPEVVRVLDPQGLFLLCWQEWMHPESVCEQVYRLGWEEVQGEVPKRQPGRGGMADVAEQMGRPLGAWDREVAGNYTPKSLASFFLSRESTGQVDDTTRQRLQAAWRTLAENELGGRIPYTFCVGARLYDRAMVRSRIETVRGAGQS